MENKSEMINRIAELAEENAELKKYIERMDKPEIQVIDAEILTLKEENAKLNAIIDGYQPKIQALKDENYGLNQELLGYKKGVQAAEIVELKAENEKLKEEVETRDNLVEHFRKEAINWAKIANDCIKDIEKPKRRCNKIKSLQI